ncbi:Uncharacterised protein [Neisseria animalis]|nr:Uncharacterised protein [Neisseria animalis]
MGCFYCQTAMLFVKHQAETVEIISQYQIQ